MSTEKPTLKDIALKLGVSTTTVHRALHGKDGVGDEMTQEIKRLATDLGYKANVMAAALKQKPRRFAIVLPEPTMDGRYYYMSLWNGARRLFSEAQEYNVDVLEYFYPSVPGGHGAMLKQVWESTADELDGLVTIASDLGQTAYYLEKFFERRIPFTLVGADTCKETRLCCVKALDEHAGSLAAELLTAFQPPNFSGKIILTGNPVGSFSMLDQFHNLKGFEEYLSLHAPHILLLSAFHADAQTACETLRSLLTEHPDAYAVYSISARHSVRAGRLLEELGLAGTVKLVGNDLFAENADLLRRGTLTAIIDKKVEKQSYHAARVLFDYVVKGEYPVSSTLSIDPSVVLSSAIPDV